MIGASVCGESSGRCCGCLPRCHGGQALSVDQMAPRSEEHTSELQSQSNLVCRLLLEKKENVGLFQHTHDSTTTASSWLGSRPSCAPFLAPPSPAPGSLRHSASGGGLRFRYRGTSFPP